MPRDWTNDQKYWMSYQERIRKNNWMEALHYDVKRNHSSFELRINFVSNFDPNISNNFTINTLNACRSNNESHLSKNREEKERNEERYIYRSAIVRIKKETRDNQILIFHPAFVNASLDILRSVWHRFLQFPLLSLASVRGKRRLLSTFVYTRDRRFSRAC